MTTHRSPEVAVSRRGLGIARTLAAAWVACSLLFPPLSGSTPKTMPVDEIRPGMVGVGRTVFAGTAVEEFMVHVLGVLHNVVGPRRSLVLVRLDGGPLAQTGVVAGMSGSPVYIEGRLVGAVAYALGAFSKEPIAGITPIAEMIEAAALGPPRTAIRRRAQLRFPVTPDGLREALSGAFIGTRPFADRPDDVRHLGGLEDVSWAAGAPLATLLRPIATPLVMSGFRPEVQDLVAGAFRAHGFAASASGSGQQGASAAAPMQSTPALQPGDAVGINLLTGDLTLGATGTVTHLDGDRVYAFGHPLYNLGPTEFPMTRAFVHALLPSLLTSVRIATTGDTIGTFQQDRATTIAGTLGKGPVMIPIKVSLDTERGLRKAFQFRVVSDQLLTPLLTYVSILNTLVSYEREFGAATFTVKGKALVKNHGEIAFEDLFTGNSPSVGAATYIAAPITFLLGNDFEPVEIEGVDLTISSTEQPRIATLERVWFDEVRPRAGRTIPLKLLLRTYRGEEVVRTVPVEIPGNASGQLSVLVSDGSRLTQWEQREARQQMQPRGIAQMIRLLNSARKNNRLYVKLLSGNPGAVVDGEYLSSLPPSVLAVLEGDRSGGTFIPLRNGTLGEWEILIDHAVSGSRLLTIDVGAHQ